MFMKLIIGLFLTVNFIFALDLEEIKLNDKLSKEIYETVELVYLNIDDMKRTSLYFDVSENKDYEMNFYVESLNVEKSKYTYIGLKSLNNKDTLTKGRLFDLKINRNKTIEFVNYNTILSKEDVLSKQDLILKFVLECKEELLKRTKIKQNRQLNIKNKFLEEQ